MTGPNSGIFLFSAISLLAILPGTAFACAENDINCWWNLAETQIRRLDQPAFSAAVSGARRALANNPDASPAEHAAVQPAIDRFRGALSDERLETAARDGLTTAALAWSPDGATPFATYAAWWIRAALTKATNDATPLPRARPFEAWAASAEAAPNDVPTPDEVRRLLAERPDAVTDRQRQVLHARYGLDDGTPRSLIEGGAAIGLSRVRVRSIERDALSALRGETDGG